MQNMKALLLQNKHHKLVFFVRADGFKLFCWRVNKKIRKNLFAYYDEITYFCILYFCKLSLKLTQTNHNFI